MTSVESVRPETDAEPLRQAQLLMQAGDFAGAEAALAPLLAADPDHAEGLYLNAVCARYAGRSDDAFSRLQALKSIAPEFGRAHQEEGHLLRALDRREAALTAFARACRYNPALEASWRAQADLLDAAGRADEAQAARAQAQRLAALPKPLIGAMHLLHDGKLLKAERACRVFLQKTPHHVEGMRLLAEIGSRLGVLEDAEFLLESARELEPGNTQVWLDYIQILRKRQKFEAARDQAKALYETDPANPVFQSHFAIESMQTGDYDTALELFDSILERLPSDPATLTSKGHALKTLGRQDDAVAAYRAAFAAKPDHGDAYSALANLKTYRFTDAEIAAMRSQLATPGLEHAARVHFAFALAKALEDAGDMDGAFDHYEMGNTLKRGQSRYSADQMDAEFEAQKAICTPDLFAATSGQGCPAPDPIFILGLPRSGSTLVEQILASHSQVDGTLELPNILALAHRLGGRIRGEGAPRYPGVLADLKPDQLRQFGEDYIEKTRIHRRGAPRFTDKMPNNFRHIGLIRLILPNAKIIDARRDPMDCCVSGFKQLFAEGQEFTYGLDEMGRYYRGYADLMDHWDRIFPGAVLRVQHEVLVADLETQIRRILDFCGLPFEPACLTFYETERAVRTASSEQVRQPVSGKAIGGWRRFAHRLGPLIDALGPDLAPSVEVDR